MKINEYLEINKEVKSKEIANYIGLSVPRTRAILTSMENVETIGSTTNRRYRLKKRGVINK